MLRTEALVVNKSVYSYVSAIHAEDRNESDFSHMNLRETCIISPALDIGSYMII